MKQFVKDNWLWLATIAIVILYFGWRIRSTANDQKQTENSIIAEQLAEIERYRTENGLLKQQKQAAIIASSQKDQLIENYEEAIQDLRENHDVDVKNLHAYYRARITTTGSGTSEIRDTVMVQGDTVKVFSTIRTNDGFLDYKGFWDDAGFASNYTYTDSISIAWSWKMKGIWPFRRKDKLLVSLVSSNPKAVVNHVQSFAVYDNDVTRLTIGPHIGWDPFNGVTAGVSVQYPLIRINW